MTRRSFNKSLLPVEPPERIQRAYAPQKKRIRKYFEETKDFMQTYIKLSGEYFDKDDMATACCVKASTINCWKFGTPPGRLTHTLIARYFARTTRRSYPLILAEIEDAYETGLQNWSRRQAEEDDKNIL
jgi:hypothetical protein